jgi:kynurenine 3-monooxygenase
MFGRHLHFNDGGSEFYQYDPRGSELIYAISRSELTALLIDTALREPNIELIFGEKLIDLHVTPSCVMPIFSPGEGATDRFEFMIGADGAMSSVRDILQRMGGVYFTRKTFPYVYKEVSLLPQGAPFRRDALHIWARGSFMLVGLPGRDETQLDGTLFISGDSANAWFSDAACVQHRFREFFPNVTINVVQAGDLVQRPIGHIWTIEGGPWHTGRVVLVGDAAHALTPFLGQGMNCALEDSALLAQKIDACAGNYERAFCDFFQDRRPDTSAITHLSAMHCDEMMKTMRTADYGRRKSLEGLLATHFPDTFVPYYSLISFDRMPYSKVLRLKELQDHLLDRLLAYQYRGQELLPCKNSEVLTEISRYRGEAAFLELHQ